MHPYLVYRTDNTAEFGRRLNNSDWRFPVSAVSAFAGGLCDDSLPIDPKASRVRPFGEKTGQTEEPDAQSDFSAHGGGDVSRRGRGLFVATAQLPLDPESRRTDARPRLPAPRVAGKATT